MPISFMNIGCIIPRNCLIQLYARQYCCPIPGFIDRIIVGGIFIQERFDRSCVLVWRTRCKVTIYSSGISSVGCCMSSWPSLMAFIKNMLDISYIFPIISPIKQFGFHQYIHVLATSFILQMIHTVCDSEKNSYLDKEATFISNDIAIVVCASLLAQRIVNIVTFCDYFVITRNVFTMQRHIFFFKMTAYIRV